MFGLKIKSYVVVQTLIAAVLNVGEVMNGYMVAWSAPIIPKLLDPLETPLPYLISEKHQSWVASIVYFGCIGAFIAGFSSNKIGRQKTLTIGSVICLLSNVLLTAARNLAMVYIGRFIIGIGLCLIGVAGLSYIGEIASPNIRGIILTSMGVFHALGSLLVYSVGPSLSYAGVGYVVLPINILFVVLSWFLPESPMFYIIKNDEASARLAFQYLGRDVDVNSELKTMMENVREHQQQTQIWRELLTVKINQRSLFITVCLAFFQQSSGIMAVLFFATTIFQDSGSSVRPDIATIIIGATFAVGASVSPLVIEKYGRRMLLLVSTAGCCISMTILGVYFYLKMINYPYINQLGWVPLICLVVAIFIYSVGLSIIPNTLMGELFTPKARGLGPSFGITCGWISGFLSTTAFSYAVVSLGGHVTFWIFAAINGLAFLFVVMFVPETKGKSLMEIQMILEKGKCPKEDTKSSNADVKRV